MVLIEIVIPDYDRRLFMSVDESTNIRKLRKRICEVVGPRALSHEEDYLLIEIEGMNLWPDDVTVSEAGLVNGSRLLLLKGEMDGINSC